MKKDYYSRPYRACVGMFLLNYKNEVFVGKRIDYRSESWQMPQGGIDDGETISDACFRELKEEIGTNHASIIYEIPKWLYYDIPEEIANTLWEAKFKGQKQKWIFLKFLGKNQDINLNNKNPEFEKWKWVKPEVIASLAVNFKKNVYKEVVLNYFNNVQKLKSNL